MESIVDIINGKYGGLTRKQKEIADYMLSHTDDMCFSTLKNLSREIKVSEMTILNLCTVLGYPNFNEVKYAFRTYAASRRQQASAGESLYGAPYTPKRELNDEENLFRQMCQEEMDALGTFYKGVDTGEYFRAAGMITSAKNVIICGRGVARQVTHYVATRLNMCGISCIEVDTESGDSVQSALYFVNKEALVIPVSFPDYYFMTVKLAQYAKDKGARLLGITDTTRAEVSAMCDMCLYCPTNTRLFLNSLSAPMVCAHFLTTAVSITKTREGGDASSRALELSKMFGAAK